jgi:hypothetical protein
VDVDLTGALAHLEAVGPSVEALQTPPGEPRTVLDAVREYAAAVGVSRGRHVSPPAAVWRQALLQRADAMGWVGDYPRHLVGRALVALGFRRVKGLVVGYLVDAQTATSLWVLAGGKRPRATRPAAKPRLAMPRALRTLQYTYRPTRPVRTCDGREWASTGQLAKALRCSRAAVVRALQRHEAVRGLHVSYLAKASRPLQASGTVSVHDDGHQDGSGI